MIQPLYYDQVVEWRQKRFKNRWKKFAWKLLYSTLSIFTLILVIYVFIYLTRFETDAIQRVLVYNLVFVGLYILFTYDALDEYRELGLISSFIFPMGFFLYMTFFASDLSFISFFILPIILGGAYFSILDVLRGRVILKKTRYPQEQPVFYYEDGSVRSYKRKLLLERWNIIWYKVLFVLSFFLLFFGALILDVFMYIFKPGPLVTFAALNMISIGFILMTADIAWTEFKEKRYISSLLALIYCEFMFILTSFGKIVIPHENAIFFVLFFVVLVLVSPIDMLMVYIRNKLRKDQCKT